MPLPLRIGPSILAILAGWVAIPVWPDHVSSGQDQPVAPGSRASGEFDPKTACAEVVKAHNRIRAESKRPALVVSTKLQAAAERHAKDMAAHEKMAHNGKRRIELRSSASWPRVTSTVAPARTSRPVVSRSNS